jgi:hypothetical protein
MAPGSAKSVQASFDFSPSKCLSRPFSFHACPEWTRPKPNASYKRCYRFGYLQGLPSILLERKFMIESVPKRRSPQIQHLLCTALGD